MRRRGLLGLGALAAGAVALGSSGRGRRIRDRLVEAFARFRRSSSPSVGLYDLATGVAMGGVYTKIADDLAREAPQATRILDIGCGPGRLLVELGRRFPDARLTGVDLDQAMVERARERMLAEGRSDHVVLAVADAAHLPFLGESFDLITSSFSIHHWGEERDGMQEVARVLAPGGVACLYDVPGWFGRLEGNAGIDRAVAVAPFAEKQLEPFPWPRWVSLVWRARLR